MLVKLIIVIMAAVIMAAATTINALDVDIGAAGPKFSYLGIDTATTDYLLHGTLQGTGCEFKLTNVIAKTINVTADFGANCKIIIDNLVIRNGTLEFLGSFGDNLDATFNRLDLVQNDNTNPYGAFSFQPKQCKNCKISVTNSYFARNFSRSAPGAYSSKHPAKCANSSFFATVACVMPLHTMTLHNNTVESHGMDTNTVGGFAIRGLHPVNEIDTFHASQMHFRMSGTEQYLIIFYYFYVRLFGLVIEDVKMRLYTLRDSTFNFGGADSGYMAAVMSVNRTQNVLVYNNDFYGYTSPSATGGTNLQHYGFLFESANFTDEEGSGNTPPGTPANLTVIHNRFNVSAKKAYGVRASYKIRGARHYVNAFNHYELTGTQNSGFVMAISGTPGDIQELVHIYNNTGRIYHTYQSSFIYVWDADSDLEFKKMLIENNVAYHTPISKSYSLFSYFIFCSDTNWISNMTEIVARNNNFTNEGSMAWNVFFFAKSAYLGTVNLTDNHFSARHIHSGALTTSYAVYGRFMYAESNITTLNIERNDMFVDLDFKFHRDSFIELGDESNARKWYQAGSIKHGTVRNNTMITRGTGQEIKWMDTQHHKLGDIDFSDNRLIGIEWDNYASSTSEFGFLQNHDSPTTANNITGTLRIRNNYCHLRTQYNVFWFSWKYDGEINGLEITNNTFISEQLFTGATTSYAYTYVVNMVGINNYAALQGGLAHYGTIKVNDNLVNATSADARLVYFSQDTFLVDLEISGNTFVFNTTSTYLGTIGLLLHFSTSTTYPIIVQNFRAVNNRILPNNTIRPYFVYGGQLTTINSMNISFNYFDGSTPRSPAYASTLTSYRYSNYFFYITAPTSGNYRTLRSCSTGCVIESNTILGPIMQIFQLGGYYSGPITIKNNSVLFRRVADTILPEATFLKLTSTTYFYDSASLTVSNNTWNVTNLVETGSTTHTRHAKFLYLSGDLTFYQENSGRIEISTNKIDARNLTMFSVAFLINSMLCSVPQGKQQPGASPYVLIKDNELDVEIYAAATIAAIVQSQTLCQHSYIALHGNKMRIYSFKSQEAPYTSRRSAAFVTMDSYIRGGAMLSASDTSYIASPPSPNSSQLVLLNNAMTLVDDPQMAQLPVMEMSFVFLDYTNGPASASYRFVANMRNNSISFGPAAIAAAKFAATTATPDSSFFLISNTTSTNSFQASTIYLEDNTLAFLGVPAANKDGRVRFALGNTDSNAEIASQKFQIFIGPACNTIVQINAATGTALSGFKMQSDVFATQLIGAEVQPPTCDTITRSLSPPRTETGTDDETATALTPSKSPSQALTFSALDTRSDVLTPSDYTPSISVTLSRSLNTQSETRTISLIPPIVTVGMSLEAKAAAATQAATVSAVATFAAPSAAMTAMRILAVFDLMGCPPVDSNRQKWNEAMLSYPATLPMFTGFGFGSDEGRYARGAVIGFIIAFAFAFVMSFLGGMFLEWRRRKTEKEEKDKERERMAHERFLLRQRSLGLSGGAGMNNNNNTRSATTNGTSGLYDPLLDGDDLLTEELLGLRSGGAGTNNISSNTTNASSQFHNNIRRATTIDVDLLSETSSEERLRLPQRTLLQGAIAAAPYPWLIFFALSQTLFFWSVAAGMVIGLMKPKDMVLGLVPIFSVLAFIAWYSYTVVDKIMFSKHGPRVTRSLIYRPKTHPQWTQKIVDFFLHPVPRTIWTGFYTWQLPRIKNLSQYELQNRYENGPSTRTGGGSAHRSGLSSSDSSSSSSDDDFANDADERDEDIETILAKRQAACDLLPRMRGVLTKFWGPLHRKELQVLEEEARMDLGMQSARQRSSIMTLAEEQMEIEEEEIAQSWLLRCVHQETVLWRVRARLCPHFMFIQCLLAATVGLCQGFGRTGPNKYCKKAARAVAFFNTLAFVIVVVLRPYIVPSLNLLFILMEGIGTVCSLIGVFLIQEGLMDKESSTTVEMIIVTTVLYGSLSASVLSMGRPLLNVFMRMPIVPRVEVFRRVRSDLDDITMVVGTFGGSLALLAELLF